MKKLFVLLAVLFLFSLTALTIAHPGKTDSKGGHYNRKTGEYHYHNKDANSVSKKITDANASELEKLKAEIASLKEKNKKQNELIKKLKADYTALKNENFAMRKVLTDANMPLPKIETIADANVPTAEPNSVVASKPMP
jgi:peptidoglycan hydrolase CwlO-like protein